MTDENVTVKEFLIPPGVENVLQTLEAQGFEAWLVGGCVRDHLLGKIPKDYDVATNASTCQVMSVFEGVRVIETGVKHGTVTVISGGIPVEVTTFRTDGAYSDGRHPDSVRFASDIRDDLGRRDFTVNAIAYSPRRGYVDLFGGGSDLRSGVIRCVGDPDVRFGEDALRILRAMRFASVLGFAVEDGTAASIHRCKGLLSKIAVERVTKEFTGLLCGANAAGVLREYADVVALIIPPCAAMFGFEQHNPYHDRDVWEHTLGVVQAVPPVTVMRLAALLHDVGKPLCFTVDESGRGHFYGHETIGADIVRHVLDSYIRVDRHTGERVLFLVEHHGEPILPDRKIMRRRLARYGEEPLRQLIALHRADTAGQAADAISERPAELEEAERLLDALVEESACTTLSGLAVRGGDLMAMGIPKGPMIGRILNELLREVCAETLENSGQALRARASQLYSRMDG